MITSTSNQQMKNISALLKKSKERRNSGTFDSGYRGFNDAES
jgi:hypothetical protein